MSLVGLYVFTLAYKELGLSRFCTRRICLLALPSCAVLMFLGLWSFEWIPSFVVTCFAFEFVKKLKLPDWLAKASIFLAPSMFSIYLLHICNCTHLMWSFEVYCVDTLKMPLYVMFTLTAIVTFFVSLAVDLARRFTLIPVRTVIDKTLRKVDDAYARTLDILAVNV